MVFEKIFLADWFMSPEVFLIREGKLNIDDRLDSILLERAKSGVKIYILVWNETKIAVNLASQRVKNKLERLHKHIHVQLHPFVQPLKWSNA